MNATSVLCRPPNADSLSDNGRSEAVIRGPGGASSGEVLGHLLLLRLFEDLPRQEVAKVALLFVGDQVAKEAVPDALKNKRLS